jgi:phage terminase large subunit
MSDQDAKPLYAPRPQFMPFHLRTQRWGVLVCHRRAGKTVAAVNELLAQGFHTDKPDGRYSYVAPYYAQAKAVAWDYLLRFSAPIMVKANIAELSVEIKNARGTTSRVRLFGGDNPDALRGLYHDGVIMDEPAQMKPRLWPEIIRPALSDRKGWAVFTGTPAGKNEFWDIYQQALKNPDAWFSMVLKASESGILDDEELAAAREMMDEDGYAQEYECSFDAAIRGSFYGKLMNAAEAEGRIGEFPYVPGHKVNVAFDLGIRDETVVWFFQVIGGNPRFIDCYGVSGVAISDILNTLAQKKASGGWQYGEFYLPHDARADSLQTGRSIQEQLHAANIRAQIVPSLSVQDGIQAVRLMLPHATFDAVNCRVGLEAMRQYQRMWDEETKTFRQKPRHDWASNYADSMRYAAIAYREEFDPGPAYIPERYKTKPNITDGMTLNALWETLPQRRERRI